MGNHPRHLCAILCVLLLNLQVFAAQAMGCMHQAEEQAVSGCPHMLSSHAAVASEPTTAEGTDPSAVEPCQKCDLNSVAAGWHLFAVHPPVLASTASPPPRAAPAAPFSTRSPDGLLRPPQRISA